jgi:hypothetical protein
MVAQGNSERLKQASLLQGRSQKQGGGRRATGRTRMDQIFGAVSVAVKWWHIEMSGEGGVASREGATVDMS